MTVAPIEPRDPGAGWFVTLVFGALLVSAIGFVVTFGPPFPRWDDFAMLPVLTGAQRVTVGWLWSQHNEHRVLLPRLVLLGLLKLSRNDFRAGMIFSVAVLAAAALVLTGVIRRRRGAWRETDAIPALLLLNLGHATNFLWAWQVQFTLSTALAVAWLSQVVAAPEWPRVRGTLGLVATLLALPACGANGLALVPALAAWLIAAGVTQVQRPDPADRRAGLANLVAAAGGLILVAWYFRDYHRAAHIGTRATIAEAVTTGLQFFSLTLGPVAEPLWPYSGAAVAVLTIATLALLARVAYIRADERPRALGLLAYFAALGALGAGLGWGRAGASSHGGFEPRYITLAAPLGCVLYVAWDLYGPRRALRRLVTLGMLAALLVCLGPNTQTGLEVGREHAAQTAAILAEVRSGAPLYLVVKKAWPFLHPSEDELPRLLLTLRDLHISGFEYLQPNPPFRTVNVPLEPIETRLLRWDHGTAHVTGVDPQLTFALPAARPLIGIRLRYSHSNPAGLPGRFKLAWRRPGQADFTENQTYVNWNLPSGKDLETTIWVADVVKEVRIQPDNRPCEFHIESLQMLVPEG